ncbi:hypothetical protein F4778DRAFT_777220 [Xylariomycetidae sp. FL2044]|nr:hypothetical protein F4778DRAFT_777220 [Xylariomycetidae sp. FL2044]
MVYEWNEETIQQFFRGRESVSQSVCDSLARNIAGGGWTVEPVGTQGSYSYTLVCTKKMILSFRRPGSLIPSQVIDTAKQIHGDLIAGADYCGKVGQDAEVLSIYKMPCLPGRPCLELYPRTPKFTELEDEKCKFDYLEPIIDEIEEVLPELYQQGWPQVLTHHDFSKLNILIDEETFAITGVVDWCRGSFQPFGLDLSLLSLMRGFTDDSDHSTTYESAAELERNFWDEFWAQTGIEEAKRSTIKEKAELVANLEIILCYGFNMTREGDRTDVPITVNEIMLREMFERTKA